MKRSFACWCALVCLLVMPAVASARSRTASAASSRIVAIGSLSGTITAINGSSITVETPGRLSGAVDAMIAAANRITKKNYPYVYGGGHAKASVASVGMPGPGYNGHRIGFDCSGSVAAVLSAGDLWPARSGVPNDAWMIRELLQERLIARGPGPGPVDVMLYDDPGIHIFMSIDGAYFGTTDGGGGGDSRGGPGWLNDGAPFAWGSVYRRYHFVPSALHGTAGSSRVVTFQVNDPQTVSALQLHQKVHVAYVEAASGTLIATTVS